MIDFFSQWGVVGMFLVAFLSGSVLPINSETVLTILLLPGSGVAHGPCVAAACIGNIFGGMVCYTMGRKGDIQWIERNLHVKRKRLDHVQRFVSNKGSYIAVLGFLPVLGSVIIITMGLLRANPVATFIYMSIGKSMRYIIIAAIALGIFSLF
jgi:membrane protein YqaA with SNARE-associated domain